MTNTSRISVGAIEVRRLVNCAGLHSDRIVKLTGSVTEARIVAFRGEHSEVEPAKRLLVRIAPI